MNEGHESEGDGGGDNCDSDTIDSDSDTLCDVRVSGSGLLADESLHQITQVLSEAAFSPGGLQCDEVRRWAWPLLLGIPVGRNEEDRSKDSNEDQDIPNIAARCDKATGDEDEECDVRAAELVLPPHLEPHIPRRFRWCPGDVWRCDAARCLEEQSETIRKDVDRSLCSWTDVHDEAHLSTDQRTVLREQLFDILKAVIHRHKSRITYAQGFNDIGAVFLQLFRSDSSDEAEIDAEVMRGDPDKPKGANADASFTTTERFTLFLMSDYLSAPLERSVMVSLELMGLIIHKCDPAIHTFLSRCGRRMSERLPGGEFHFCLPWLLTWFAHTFPTYNQVVTRRSRG